MAEPIDQQLVHYVNDREKAGRDALVRSGYPKIWQDAINAFQNKGMLTNPDGANVKVNRFISDLKTIMARDAKFLLGSEPFFPLEAKQKQTYGDMARMMEQVLNESVLEARPAGGYLTLLDCLYNAAGLGVSYLLAEWDIQIQSKIQRGMANDPVLGIPLEMRSEQEMT